MQSYLYQIIKPSCRSSWIWNNSPIIWPEVETTHSLGGKKNYLKIYDKLFFELKWLLLLLMYPEIYLLPKILWILLHLFHLKIVFIMNKSFSSFSNSDISTHGTLTTFKLFVLFVNNGSTKIFATFFIINYTFVESSKSVFKERLMLKQFHLSFLSGFQFNKTIKS